MNIEPTKNFCDRNTNRKGWQDITDTAIFNEAVQAALVQYQMNMPAASDMGNAAAIAMRLQGAREFAHLLTHLADAPKEISPRPTPNLQHRT